MTDITDPQAITYSNSVIRPLADAYCRLYFAAKVAAAEFTAKGLSSIITNSSGAILEDSAFHGDGRTIINGADINILLANVASVVSTLEATSNLILNQTLKIAVNPT